MKTETKNIIRSIYIYFFSALGTILLIVGIYSGVQFTVKKMALPQYPLESYRETQCDTMYPTTMSPNDKGQQPSATEAAAQRADCKVKLEQDRKVQEVKDLANSVTLVIIGIILLALHFPRTWREKI